MHIDDILTKNKTTFSFEFFPPKTEKGVEHLRQAIAKLEAYNPDFVSITYGAGGGTRELTHDLCAEIKKGGKLEPVSHLTCVGHSEAEIKDILARYAEANIDNILALRGDPPRGSLNYDWGDSDFKQAADLVKFIKKYNDCGVHKDERGFGIGVAGFPEGHPATPNRLLEMDYLKAKVDVGADYIVTQLFFDNNDFYDFRDRCELAGINVPIIAGIMPVTNKDSMKRMAELAGGAHFPAKLLRMLERCGDDKAAAERAGVHYASEQCADLLHNNVRGLHFYTLNKSGATRKIYENLNLARA